MTPLTGGLPRGTERMLALLEVGRAGEGLDGIKSSGAEMLCARVILVKLSPLPAAAAPACLPRQAFWLPAGGGGVEFEIEDAAEGDAEAPEVEEAAE